MSNGFTQKQLEIIGYLNGYATLVEYQCALERREFPKNVKTKKYLRDNINSLATDIPEEIGNYLRYRPHQLKENLIRLMENLEEQ